MSENVVGSCFGRLAGSIAASLCLLACSAAPGDDAADVAATSDDALTSATTTFLVPVDDRARRACRDEVNRGYCDAASAERARASCVAKIGARGLFDACSETNARSGRCVRFESVGERCTNNPLVYPTAESCGSPRPLSCHFYSACLEPSKPCGEDGYALGFGERYCYAFKNASFSSRGVAWRDNVMTCLQESLVEPLFSTEPVSCSELSDDAFGAHPDCYTRREASICFLPPTDLAAVFGVIGVSEALAPRTRTQITRVIGTCIGTLAGRIFGFGGQGIVAGSPFAPTLSPASVGAPAPGDALTDAEAEATYAFWLEKAREYDVAR